MLGGLARRVAFVEREKSAGKPVLVVDSGDLFFEGRIKEDSKNDLTKAVIIGKAYRRIGAAAVNVGCLDLIQGVDFLRQENSQGLPLISANLLNPSTKVLLFQPYVIKEVAELRVAFFGLLPPESGPEISPAIRRANEGKILISNPVEAARETFQILQGRADLIVLLSDLGLSRDQMVARAVPGIHFILGGHEGRFTKGAHRSDKTFILQSSAKGMNVGHLRLTLESIGLPFRDEGEPLRLQERIGSLDVRLQGMQSARESKSAKDAGNLDRSIQDLIRQRNGLQEELKKARQAGQQGNRFLFTPVPMEMSLPEDEEVKKWIAGVGIEKD